MQAYRGAPGPMIDAVRGLHHNSRAASLEAYDGYVGGLRWWLAYLGNIIFNEMSSSGKKDFPERLIKSIRRPDLDIDLVQARFFLALVTDPEVGLLKHVPEGNGYHQRIEQIRYLLRKVEAGEGIKDIWYCLYFDTVKEASRADWADISELYFPLEASAARRVFYAVAAAKEIVDIFGAYNFYFNVSEAMEKCLRFVARAYETEARRYVWDEGAWARAYDRMADLLVDLLSQAGDVR